MAKIHCPNPIKAMQQQHNPIFPELEVVQCQKDRNLKKMGNILYVYLVKIVSLYLRLQVGNIHNFMWDDKTDSEKNDTKLLLSLEERNEDNRLRETKKINQYK